MHEWSSHTGSQTRFARGYAAIKFTSFDQNLTMREKNSIRNERRPQCDMRRNAVSRQSCGCLRVSFLTALCFITLAPCATGLFSEVTRTQHQYVRMMFADRKISRIGQAQPCLHALRSMHALRLQGGGRLRYYRWYHFHQNTFPEHTTVHGPSIVSDSFVFSLWPGCWISKIGAKIRWRPCKKNHCIWMRCVENEFWHRVIFLLVFVWCICMRSCTIPVCVCAYVCVYVCAYVAAVWKHTHTHTQHNTSYAHSFNHT
jgi:hypothetical protein